MTARHLVTKDMIKPRRKPLLFDKNLHPLNVFSLQEDMCQIDASTDD